MSEEWKTTRKQEIKHQVSVSPEDHRVIRRNGEGCKISAVFVRFERSGPGEDWRGPRVSLVAQSMHVPVLNVPRDIRSAPGWLEDIIARAEPRS